jgi:hypothetical protein
MPTDSGRGPGKRSWIRQAQGGNLWISAGSPKTCIPSFPTSLSSLRNLPFPLPLPPFTSRPHFSLPCLPTQPLPYSPVLPMPTARPDHEQWKCFLWEGCPTAIVGFHSKIGCAIEAPRKCKGHWWASRTSNPVKGASTLLGEFDSHALPPFYSQFTIFHDAVSLTCL